MTENNIRVRFAPSPTGFMHLGNVRAALVNFLFALQKQGTFVLRIEDTDANRNIDPMGKQIINDLEWLGLNYQEGPIKGGPYEPYYQSMRQDIYKQYLDIFIEKNLVYRCFCTTEELEKKRERQLALKMPPRYDRACAAINSDDKLAKNTPFIWRFKLDYTKPVEFYDLAHKNMHFELKHFSDIPLTRQDGSFTFMFANFVDDVQMRISHVFRGEDHLSNTAAQVAMYNAMGVKLPIFWHLPIIGNKEGKKLSKRDFGFSLTDLRNAGFLPEALCNYLGIIGASFENEIMPIDVLAKAINFEHLSSTGQIKYDLEKLRWVNHHWIMEYNTAKLTKLCRVYLEQVYQQVAKLTDQELESIIKPVQPEMVTLLDCVELLRFYFEPTSISKEFVLEFGYDNYKDVMPNLISLIKDELNSKSLEDAIKSLQNYCKANNLPVKDIFTLLRVALTGKSKGLGIKDLISLLGTQESLKRLQVLA